MSDLQNHILSHPLFPKNRLPSLYSDFRTLATTNPSGYRANLHAWLTALSSAARAGLADPSHSRLLLSTDDSLLADLQTREYGRPLALGAVVEEAVRQKDLYPLDEFLKQPRSIYHWTYLGAVASWGWGKIVGVPGVPDRKLRQGRWVVVKNVEEVAKETLQLIGAKAGRVQRVYTLELLAEELGEKKLSETDLRVLVRFLEREKREVAVLGKTLKFRDPDGALEDVTKEDASIAQLRTLLATLVRRCDQLAETITLCNTRARTAIAGKNRLTAAAALRSRKTAESALSTQLGALHQVEEVLSSITQAADNVELVNTLERSAGVLRSLNKEVGGAERVDRVMEGVREEVDKVREINEVLGETGVEVDEGEVEDELERMLREQGEAEERERDAEGLEKTLAESLKGLEITPTEEERERERVPLEAS